jgi:hypothetical protein
MFCSVQMYMASNTLSLKCFVVFVHYKTFERDACEVWREIHYFFPLLQMKKIFSKYHCHDCM